MGIDGMAVDITIALFGTRVSVCERDQSADCREQVTYHKEIQESNSHPESSPQGVYDRDQHISRDEPLQARYELRQSSKSRDEGKEDERRFGVSIPACNPGCGDEGGRGEAGETHGGGRRDGAEEDGDLHSWRERGEHHVLRSLRLGSLSVKTYMGVLVQDLVHPVFVCYTHGHDG